MNPDDYCQEAASKSGSSFYYSFLFLPPEKRKAITALYAFCRAVDDIVDDCIEPQIAKTKLDWWQGEINQLYAGNPSHPITKALQPAINNYTLPQELFCEIIDGMAMDLTIFEYQTFKDLSLYCYRAAGVVGILSAEIFGYENRATLKYAHDLGTCLQLINIIRDVGEDATRGRIYLPAEDLIRFGVYAPDILALKNSEALKACLAFQAQRAREYYQQAMTHLPQEDRAQQKAGLIMANIYLKLLDEIENNGFNSLNEKLSLSPIRKLWIGWRTYRSEKKYAKQ